jgi:hypothetical protein
LHGLGVSAATGLNRVVASPDRQAMTTAAKANWCVHIVVDDEAERLGTVQAQTYQEAYQEAAIQFGVSPERQSRLFVRPINRPSRLNSFAGR